MKGLILQDLYIMKNNLIICSILCLYFFAILMVGSPSSETTEINSFIYALCGIMPCFLTSCVSFTINTEKNSKISLYINTLPLTKNAVTKEKYFLSYTLFFISYILIALFTSVNLLVCNYKIKVDNLFICLLILTGILLFTNLELPLTLKFGPAISAALLIFFIFLIIVIGLALVIRTNTTPDLIQNKIATLLKHKTEVTIGAVLLNITSCFISYKCASLIN